MVSLTHAIYILTHAIYSNGKKCSTDAIQKACLKIKPETMQNLIGRLHFMYSK